MSLTATEITNMATYTAQEKSKTDTLTGAADELSSNDFLNLMLEQLQYQDPMNPLDNQDWMAQTAQFTQLETTQEINDKLADSSTVSQALSLVDKHVILQNPDNSSKAISGTVDAVCVDGSNTSITVGGKNYPLSSVMYVYDGAATDGSTNTDSSASSGSSDSSGSSS